MNTVPPRWVRRLLLAPLAVVLSLALIVASPALLAAAVVVDLVLGGPWRTVRLVAFCVTYLAFEAVGLVALLGLWLWSLGGLRLHTERMRDLHYRFMRWLLKGVYRAAERFFRLRIHIEDAQKPRPGPVLVFSRHAGPGNSLMLVGTMMIPYRRRPRIVMLAKLQWEPLFDAMCNRLPNRFIRHDSARRQVYLAAIRDLATGLGDQDALLLFPEGHDYTPRLRLRAIAHLRKRGRESHAEQAERMRSVLPPKHGGVMAAIAGAPDADVVFVAHTVLEDVGSFRDLWNRIPLERPIHGRYWRIPAEEVPRDRDELVEWLFGWWSRIDRWVQERVPAADAAEPAPPAR